MNIKILPAANEDLISGYHFYYTQEGDDIVVYAILDSRRNPALLTERLR